MRWILIFWIVAVSSLAVLGQIVVQEKVREGNTFKQIDPTFNGVSLSATYDDILAKLGKPVRVVNGSGDDECTGGTITSLSYSGLGIELSTDKQDPKKSTITSIVVTSPRWKMNGAIKIGDRHDKVAKVLSGSGIPNDKDLKDPNEIAYEVLEKYGPGSVTFYFENDKLTKIEIAMTTC